MFFNEFIKNFFLFFLFLCVDGYFLSFRVILHALALLLNLIWLILHSQGSTALSCVAPVETPPVVGNLQSHHRYYHTRAPSPSSQPSLLWNQQNSMTELSGLRTIGTSDCMFEHCVLARRRHHTSYASPVTSRDKSACCAHTPHTQSIGAQTSERSLAYTCACCDRSHRTPNTASCSRPASAENSLLWSSCACCVRIYHTPNIHACSMEEMCILSHLPPGQETNPRRSVPWVEKGRSACCGSHHSILCTACLSVAVVASWVL